MKYSHKIATILLAVLPLSGISTARAAVFSWTGANSANWFTNGNWDMPGFPGAADDASISTIVPNITVIPNGNSAQATNVRVGDLVGSTGELHVNGNSTLAVGNNLTAGYHGDGTIIHQGTSATTIANNGDYYVGRFSDGTGTVIVRDSATVDLLGNAGLHVGRTGIGNMTVRDSAAVTLNNGNVDIGQNGNSNGTLILKNDSTLNVTGSGTVYVGRDGTGTLEIRDNAVLGTSFGSAPDGVFIGRNAGSVGSVLVTGAGATLRSNQFLDVGGDNAGPGGQGVLKIVNGGSVFVNTDMNVWGFGSGDKGTLSVDSTYTLTVGGTLNFVGGRLNFLGDGVDFINDATLTNVPGPDQNGMFADVHDGNTATISGMLTGAVGTPGDLTKTGTGTLILTNNANTYRDTNIENGTLVVGGPTVLGTRDTNLDSGTLRTPEGMPVDFVVNRDLNIGSGTLYVQVGGTATGTHDTVAVTRDTFLDPNNSQVFIHRINGYNPNNEDEFTYLTAGGTVINEFSDAPNGVTAPNDFIGLIQPFLEYGIDYIDIEFGFAHSFASVAKTPNQIATATALDNAVAAGCIVAATNYLGNVPINSLRHAYDVIAPEELASMYEASFAQGLVQSLNLQRRMDDIRWGSTGFCADGFVIQDNHGYTKNDGKSVSDKNMVEQTAPPNYRWGSFITGSGELTKTGEEGDNANGYQLNQAGFTMGVDYRVSDHWAIGLSGGYTHTRGDLVDNGRLNTDGGRMGLYTTYYTHGFYVDAAASGGWNQYDTRRSAYLGQENGSTDGGEFNGMVALGYDWKRGCWTFGPTASFEYNYVEFNSFTESDTSLIPLHFPDQNQEAYRSNLGFRVAHEQVMKPGEGLTVVPELRASWRHDFGPQEYAIDSNFAGCTDIFTVHGPWVGRDSAVVDLGLTAYCTPGLSAYIFYDGQFGRDNYNNNAISGGFRVAF